VFLAVVLTLRW